MPLLVFVELEASLFIADSDKFLLRLIKKIKSSKSYAKLVTETFESNKFLDSLMKKKLN